MYFYDDFTISYYKKYLKRAGYKLFTSWIKSTKLHFCFNFELIMILEVGLNVCKTFIFANSGQKRIGSGLKNRVGRETGNKPFFFHLCLKIIISICGMFFSFWLILFLKAREHGQYHGYICNERGQYHGYMGNITGIFVN